MSGFVGSRARKRRRNIFLSLGIIVLIIVIILSFPNFETQNNEIIPNDNIIPDPTVELTSLASNIEELELNLFQKDQKIKFRDGQIKNLQTELKEVSSRKILNALNQNNKKVIISIKCATKDLDVRIPGRKWKGWIPAKEEFEKNLINDFC